MQAEDIFRTTRAMVDSGMTQMQAESMAETIICTVRPLATKSALEEFRLTMKEEFKGEMDSLRTELKGEMDSLKIWILKGAITAFGSGLAFFAGLAFYVVRALS